MKYSVLILATLCNISGTILSNNHRRKTPLDDIKTSVIIPCCARHAQHLYNLLKTYENQTELPDEIVISVSESDQIEKKIIELLQNELWVFPVKLILSKKKQFAGENRNIACKNAYGDIFICQDADDFPHPQRVEIIKYFFKTYHIDHLMHLCKVIGKKDKDNPRDFSWYNDFTEIKYLFSNDLNKIRNSGHVMHGDIAMAFTNGNITITRHVFNQIKWSTIMKQGQDVEFNLRVYKKFKNCISIYADLLTYRNFLSSHTLAASDYYKDQLSIKYENKKLYELVIINN